MRSHRHLTVFAPEYLDRLRAEDPDGPTVWEAEYAGPWRVAECQPLGYSVARYPEGATIKDAVFDHRETALLVAALYPGIGRDPRYRLAERPEAEGYDVVTILDGDELPIGWIRYNHSEILRGLHVVENVLRSPSSLAFFIQAASFSVLDRAGRMIAERIGGRHA